jgi:hypothetical protein
MFSFAEFFFSQRLLEQTVGFFQFGSYLGCHRRREAAEVRVLEGAWTLDAGRRR